MNVFVALAVAAGIVGAGYLAYKYVRSKLTLGITGVKEAIERVGAAAAEARDALVKQSGQTSRERAGESEYYGPFLFQDAARQSAAEADKRKAADLQTDRSTAVSKLRSQLRIVDDSGAEGYFEGDAYVSRAELVKRLAALGVTDVPNREASTGRNLDVSAAENERRLSQR